MLRFASLRLGVAMVVLAAGLAAQSTPRPATATAGAATHTALVVIINKANPARELAITDLRRMILGDVTRWPDGKKVTIAMREPGQPERDAMLRLVCGMSEAEFSRYLLHAAFRGETQGGLKQLDTPTGVRRFVFNVPGALGYVRGDELDTSVKALRLTGTLPSVPVFGLTLAVR